MNTLFSSHAPLFIRTFSCTVHKLSSFRVQIAIAEVHTGSKLTVVSLSQQQTVITIEAYHKIMIYYNFQ